MVVLNPQYNNGLKIEEISEEQKETHELGPGEEEELVAKEKTKKKFKYTV